MPARPATLGSLRLVAILIGIAVVTVIVGAGPASVARADGGVPLPAPAGTVWQIIAGYNTGTHHSEDPDALDMVRIDGATAGTPVLAPISGQLTYVGPECLTIRDSAVMNHLLCHFWPLPGMARGVNVTAGSVLGTMAPAGYAGNNGVAHIHYAVHHALGGGFIGLSVPFTGSYALEGFPLPNTGGYNEYAGRTFTSTNSAGSSSPPASPPTPPPTTPANDDAPTLADGIRLSPGWNLVGWTQNAGIADVVSTFGTNLGTVLTFDPGTQSYRQYSPHLPDSLNTLHSVRAGQAVWINITNTNGMIWRQPPPTDSVQVTLRPGFNLVTWTAPAADADTMANLIGTGLVSIYSYDTSTKSFLHYQPNAPRFLNTLARVTPGQALWMNVTDSSPWPPPAAAALAQDVEPTTPTPPPTPTPTVSTPTGGIATQARVIGPGCLNLRPAPTTLGTIPITCLTEGTVVTPSGETSLDSQGRTWLLVTVNNLTGWVAGEYVAEYAVGASVTGKATYYHPSLSGNLMYCGGIYNPNDPTIVATTVWPCGTPLRVSRGDRYVDVVVQDTGLLPANHVDLSEAAFQQLGLLAEGSLTVQIEVRSAE